MTPARPGPPPLYVRALDAFEAFYRQLAVVSQRATELRATFDGGSIASAVLAAADLNSALGVLYARLELLEAVTSDDAGRDLWTHPMMDLMRSQVRALVDDGMPYASSHPQGWRVVEQLRHLAVTLAAEAKVVRDVVGRAHSSDGPSGGTMIDDPDPSRRIATILDRSSPGWPTRCRKRRPWHRTWRSDRRGESP